MDPVIKTVHQRTCELVLNSLDIERILQDYAMKLAGFDPLATRVTITFESELSAISPYKNNKRCVINLIEDQLMVTQSCVPQSK